MCRKIILAALIIASLLGEKALATQYAFQVFFADKNNTSFSLSAPLAYLSPRSVARRTTQGIALDSTDLPVNQQYIDTVLLLTGGKIHEVSRWLNSCVILISDSTQIHNLDSKPYVLGSLLVAFYSDSLHKTAPPANYYKSPVRKTTTSGSVYYGQTWEQTNMVKGNTLYDDGYTGAGKLIAVLDAGFTDADTHPGFGNLWSSGRIVDQHNFTLATDFVLSYDAHGTKVLSTMAGNVPNTYVGSAPMASYALYVSEDGRSEQPIELLNMLSASERADSIGADVISTSLGYNTFDNPAYNFTFATDFDGKSTVAAKAANMATQKGILFVASAGNEGGNPWNNILTPGDADSALTIGSVDVTGTPAGNSGYGPNAVGRVKPDVCGLGQPGAIFEPGGGYGAEGGTSFSTPQIAGWAACLWQSYPGASPYQIRQAIIKCASAYTAPTSHLGYGIPDFSCSRQALLYVLPPHRESGAWVIVTSNPFGSELTLTISPDTDQYIDLELLDVTGRTVISARRFFNKGFNAPFVWTIPELPTGVYMLKAVAPTKQQVIRLEKI